MAHQLAEYARMDALHERAPADAPALPPAGAGARRLWWAIGLFAAALITALAFAAYRQPELLLNLMGLRYCG